MDFAATERDTLAFWEKIDAFQKQLKISEGRKEYLFYDGPPFATGLPHYGHLLAGTIKDVVTRYWSMCGYHVSRRFGWDCHGLPVEYEVETKFGLKKPTDTEGGVTIKEYNEKCRSVVMQYSQQWKEIIKRFGRWIDFDNDYKTLNASFMESVWWAFKQLYQKGLVYQGVKVMPYSTACTTPLSNFEANQNYKNVPETAITVGFKLLDDQFENQKEGIDEKLPTLILAWTTTPWTLPSNLALCVHLEYDYIKFKNKNGTAYWIVVKERVPAVVDAKEVDAVLNNVIATIKGSDLVGRRYEPLFKYFKNLEQMPRRHTVVSGDYVKRDSGTGIVHCAPFFGEDDYSVCISGGVMTGKEGPIACPVDDNGCFTREVDDYAGRYVKDCDKDIIKSLKDRKVLIKTEQITHSYPFCWRSDTPLIYKAVPSWFVNVERIKSEDLQPYIKIDCSEEYQANKLEKRKEKQAE
ncbi:MAG: putative Isoleucine--tRNA ligase, partial [Streblomastix strix]